MPNEVMVAYMGTAEENKLDSVVKPEEVYTQSFKEEDARESRLTKNDILKRSSLISSNQTNKATIVAQRQPEYDEELEPEPQKCSCEIMWSFVFIIHIYQIIVFILIIINRD